MLERTCNPSNTTTPKDQRDTAATWMFPLYTRLVRPPQDCFLPNAATTHRRPPPPAAARPLSIDPSHKKERSRFIFVGLTESVGRASCGHKANNAGDLHPVCCDGYESFRLGPMYWLTQTIVFARDWVGTRLNEDQLQDKAVGGDRGCLLPPPPLVFYFVPKWGRVHTKVSVRDPLRRFSFKMQRSCDHVCLASLLLLLFV